MTFWKILFNSLKCFFLNSEIPPYIIIIAIVRSESNDDIVCQTFLLNAFDNLKVML